MTISCALGRNQSRLGLDVTSFTVIHFLYLVSLVFCSAGQELKSGQCVDCGRGYYKSNSVEPTDTRFGACTACDGDLITDGPAGTSADDCVIRKCSIIRLAPSCKS